MPVKFTLDEAVTRKAEEKRLLRAAAARAMKASQLPADKTGAETLAAYESIRHIGEGSVERQLCVALVMYTNPGLEVGTLR
jgi:hypothetical protein